MGEHVQAVEAVADSEGDPCPPVAAVDGVIARQPTMPRRFPPGSDKGDARALPALRNGKANLETINNNMVD